MDPKPFIEVKGACENNLKNLHVKIPRNAITVITGRSGSGKSSLAFDTLLSEAQRRFFYTLSHYSRQFLEKRSKPHFQSITGLSPGIGLAQFENRPSSRSTVATLTDLGELFGILFANFADVYCPTHLLSTKPLKREIICDKIINQFSSQIIAICAPIVEKKKGNHSNILNKIAEKGFTQILVNGELKSINPIPKINPDEKNSIKLIIDQLRVKKTQNHRLNQDIEKALEIGQGFLQCIPIDENKVFDIPQVQTFSEKGSCPECGYSMPKLDSRYFSANSLGQCSYCKGTGIKNFSEDDEDQNDGNNEIIKNCSYCHGVGLKAELQFVKINDHSLIDLSLLSLHELKKFIKTLSSNNFLYENPAFMRVYNEILQTMTRICQIGLGHLQLNRRIRSLSGGEIGRLKLAGILSEQLRGVLYVLDEPSQGLHPEELVHLQKNLTDICRLGNTVVIVDHDDYLMRKADCIIDLGPGGGSNGGQLIDCFHPSRVHLASEKSLTAKYLQEKKPFKPLYNSQHQHESKPLIEIKGAYLHNLKIDKAYLQAERFNIVTGKSGSGKSSLIMKTLFVNAVNYCKKRGDFKPILCQSFTMPDSIEHVIIVDRNPLVKNSKSMPATYLDIFNPIRDIFAKLPQAQVLGFGAASFSLFQKGGRCEECKGKGELILKMRFLNDSRISCPSCGGRRYKPMIEEVRFQDHSITDILNLSLCDCLDLFKNHPKIIDKIQPAIQLGLGYIKLGQTTSSLSGGESQRLKLSTLAAKKSLKNSLMIIDEPTLGLHFADIELLKDFLISLVNKGLTLVIIEHNIELIQAAHWLVELGPGAAEDGGEVIFSGPIGDLQNSSKSLMKKYIFQ